MGVFEEEDICYVYWIRRKSHTDIFTEGYVGITNNYEYRINSHLYHCKNPKKHVRYRTDFIDAVTSGDYTHSIVIIGSRKYCYEVEERLRPSWKIGWNLAKGGKGGFGKHGLTGTKTASLYRSIMSKAKVSGEEIFSGWVGERGLENFHKFFIETEDMEGEFTLLEKGKGFSPSNLVKKSRSHIMLEKNRVYSIGDGNLYSIAELGEIFDLKPNTISTRVGRGYSLREAIGLDEVVKEKVIDPNKELAVFYLEHSPMTANKIAKKLGYNSSLKRILKDYKLPNWIFHKCEIIDRRGVTARRIPRSLLFDCQEDILDIEDAYFSGEDLGSIAERYRVHYTTITKLLEDLENASYH